MTIHLLHQAHRRGGAATGDNVICPDRVPLDDELSTVVPTIENGELVVSDAPGWGTEPIEEVIAAHPPRRGPGFLVGRGQ